MEGVRGEVGIECCFVRPGYGHILTVRACVSLCVCVCICLFVASLTLAEILPRPSLRLASLLYNTFPLPPQSHTHTQVSLCLLATLLPVDILLKDALKYFQLTWQLLKLTFTWRQPHAGVARGARGAEGVVAQHIIVRASQQSSSPPLSLLSPSALACPFPFHRVDNAMKRRITSTFTVFRLA